MAASGPRRRAASRIPLAEAAGLIIPISDWLLEQVCAQKQQRKKVYNRPFTVSVNMSPLHFRQANFIDDLAVLMERYEVADETLELEITEGMAMAGGEDIVRTLTELKAIGLGLAIDDFGTGYSSLSYLQKFPIDRLKIDKSFLDGVPDNPDSVAICEVIIQLAQILGLGIVAEGVETEAQVTFLSALGCDEAQGYYFARPLSPDALKSHFAAPVQEQDLRVSVPSAG